MLGLCTEDTNVRQQGQAPSQLGQDLRPQVTQSPLSVPLISTTPMTLTSLKQALPFLSKAFIL